MYLVLINFDNLNKIKIINSFSPPSEKKSYLNYLSYHHINEKSMRSLFKNRWTSDCLLTQYLECFLKKNDLKVNLVYPWLSREIFDTGFIYFNSPDNNLVINNCYLNNYNF